MGPNDDRTVHARLAYGAEIVRYDRAGKWYLEHDGKREQISIDHAAGIVKAFRMKPGGVTVFPGRPGGAAFDRRVA